MTSSSAPGPKHHVSYLTSSVVFIVVVWFIALSFTQAINHFPWLFPVAGLLVSLVTLVSFTHMMLSKVHAAHRIDTAGLKPVAKPAPRIVIRRKPKPGEED